MISETKSLLSGENRISGITTASLDGKDFLATGFKKKGYLSFPAFRSALEVVCDFPGEWLAVLSLFDKTFTGKAEEPPRTMP